MDGFCEQVVKRKRKAKDNILAVVYIVMALLIPAVCISLAYVITAYFIYIGFFLLLALVPLALLLINYQKVEYEYSVVDNTLSVDKIIAKRRRKKIVRLRIDEIKEMVKFNEKYTGKKINKYYIADLLRMPIIQSFILPSKSIWMDSTLNQFEYFGSVG